LNIGGRGNPKYRENLLSKGFESKQSINYNLVTSFESFEHFVDPLYEIEKILKYSDNILFSTLLLPKETPAPREWWYYAFEGGQHVSFYTKKSLEVIAKYFKMNFYTNNRNIHMISKKNINNSFFSFLINISYIIPSSFIKLGLKTKINSDMDLLAGRNNIKEKL